MEATFFKKIKQGNPELDITKWFIITNVPQRNYKILIVLKIDEGSFNTIRNKKNYPMTIKFGAFGRVRIMLDEKLDEAEEPTTKQRKTIGSKDIKI